MPEFMRMLVMSMQTPSVPILQSTESKLPPPLDDTLIHVRQYFSGRTDARMAATCRLMYHHITKCRKDEEQEHKQEPETPGRHDDLRSNGSWAPPSPESWENASDGGS